jgi:type II secretory pathway component GspD/PulD (secretin)
VRANQVLPTLQQMFSEQNRPSSGGRSTQPPVMVPLQSGDGLIVRASPTDRAAIESAVAVLDTEVLGKEKAFRFVQVEQGVPVAQIAEKVQESVNESFGRGSGGGGGGRGGEVPSVTLTPDARTNSIIISGSVQLFEEAEYLIQTLAEAGPAGSIKTAVYRPTNTKAEDLQRLIDELKRRAAGEEGSGGSRPRSSGSRPGSSRR